MKDQTHYSVFFCSVCTLPVVMNSRTAKLNEAGAIVPESCSSGAGHKHGSVGFLRRFLRGYGRFDSLNADEFNRVHGKPSVAPGREPGVFYCGIRWHSWTQKIESPGDNPPA
jgi:hypothetical protein